MGFLRDISIKKAWADTQSYFFGEKGINWKVMGLSLGCTGLILGVFAAQSGYKVKYQRPDIVWVRTVNPDMSRDDILEDNRRIQALEDRKEAIAARKAAIVRQRYCTLGKMSGLNVDTSKCDEVLPEIPPLPEGMTIAPNGMVISQEMPASNGSASPDAIVKEGAPDNAPDRAAPPAQ